MLRSAHTHRLVSGEAIEVLFRHSLIEERLSLPGPESTKKRLETTYFTVPSAVLEGPLSLPGPESTKKRLEKTYSIVPDDDDNILHSPQCGAPLARLRVESPLTFFGI
jgi:hypothetical protein